MPGDMRDQRVEFRRWCDPVSHNSESFLTAINANTELLKVGIELEKICVWLKKSPRPIFSIQFEIMIPGLSLQ